MTGSNAAGQRKNEWTVYRPSRFLEMTPFHNWKLILFLFSLKDCVEMSLEIDPSTVEDTLRSCTEYDVKSYHNQS